MNNINYTLHEINRKLTLIAIASNGKALKLATELIDEDIPKVNEYIHKKQIMENPHA